MTASRRCISFILLLVMLAGLAAPTAFAAYSQTVNLTFWTEDEKKDEVASVNDCVDTGRDAVLTRQANGTYTLELPIKKISKLTVTYYLTGLTIGEITYDGNMTGSFDDGSALLTIKNLPASILTGSNPAQGIAVNCELSISLPVVGAIGSAARLCIWPQTEV